MARACTICTHPERAAIEQGLASGSPYRDIAGRFGLSRSTVARHAADHITASVKQAVVETHAAAELARGLDVVTQLVTINNVTLNILHEARAQKNNALALQAIDRVQKQMELQAKLLGDIDSPTTVNIWLMPEWRGIRQTIIAALLPYPDARFAVAGALAAMEDERGTPAARLN